MGRRSNEGAARGLVLLIGVALLAAACGGSTPPPASVAPGSGPVTTAGTSTEAPSTPVGQGIVHEQLTGPDALLSWEDEQVAAVASSAGIETALSADGWAWVLAELRAAIADTLEREGVALDPGRIASTSADLPLTAGGAGIAGIGVVMAGMNISTALGNPSNGMNNANMTLNSTSERTANGQRTVSHMTGQIQSRVANGRATGTVAIGVDVETFDAATGQSLGTVSFHLSGTVDMDLCPDANGQAKGHVSMSLSGGTSAAGSAQITIDADVVATVNDAAYAASIDANGATTEQTASPSGTTRSNTVSAGFSGPVQGGSTFDPNAMTAHGQVDAETGDPLTSEEVTTRYERIGGAAGLAFWMLTSEAQKQWRGGACVEIHATERSRDVRPRQHVQFEARPFHKIERRDLSKPIVGTFTGEASADPMDVPVPAPAYFDYVASPTKDHSGTISLKSTSNRGIGELAITFTTRINGWMVDQASGGGRIQGQHCGDPPGDWDVSGTYDMGGMQGQQQWFITIDASGTAGTYTYVQVSQGRPMAPGVGVSPVTVTVQGDASGIVTLAIDPATGNAKLHLKEQRHTYKAKAGRGWGKAAPVPLEEGDMEWEPDPSC